ncbi:MAG: N-acetyltransferase [Bacillaceae bacterium]|uniref:N-acetyltransferase n=2 Tax=Bacillales TaxID=1385 RepID=A0A165WRF5_9BACI|nr:MULTISPECIES: GNAT family N-acetyltransferase [Aeribacillus]REJ19851.1 MAG: N-acetyltransferase [Bacillaceae bacterium]ASS89496.1 N-acetyltransferase [Aeribacillus pallidus]KZN95239.1 phosphinothricin acetyltransferase [Aeribacillus pallidus]MDR9794249.1 N-acetyltransferase family protein [Aeribacillus pallidus]MDR9796991.1 N-acetyltransferase family protein [Aeribacillus pallidus]
MENILFRDATIHDLPKIVSIYNSTIPSRMVTADTEPISVEDRIQWFHEHNPKTRPLWMIEQDGNVAGWLSFQSFYGRPAYNGTAEISIYIDEQYRGKQIGDFALKTAIEKAPSLQIKNLLGFIFKHNIPSLKLFYKNGFRDWGHFPRVAVLDGVERDLVIVGKRVAD